MSRREPHIPLFLWVATAIVAHALWGGGAQQAVTALEETFDIGTFAKSVQRHVRQNVSPLEVALIEEPANELAVEPTPPEAKEPTTPTDPADVSPDDALPEPEKKKREEEKKAEEKKPEDEKKKPEDKKPEEKKPAEPAPPVQQFVPPKAPNRIAVDQHVKPDQEDNPDAKHIADEANHVEQETRARITATDQNNAEPSPGGHFVGTQQEPGNSEESRVAQSDDHEGSEDRTPGDTAGNEPQPPTAAQPPPQVAQSGSPTQPTTPGRAAQAPREAQTAQEAMAETHQGPRGSWSISGPMQGREAQKALPERRAVRPTDLLGLGAPGTTANGVNLNLTPQLAVAAVGVDQLARERRLDGARRKSAHLGSWKSMGLERWRPALENYVASVQPGNQTALNAARVPFARYLNAIHNRLHPIFADRFLATLEGMPANHPMNRQDMVTHIEIVLSKEDGRIVRMGVTKSSGVTAFDVGALDSIQKASPYGTPPGAIVSPDGNVYLHWEFYRQPFYACSTYFAHPYMLKGTPGGPPPQVAPPKQPSYDDREGSGASPGDRSGSLDQDEQRRRRGSSEPGSPGPGAGARRPRG